jgi:hypothetical protein
MHALNVASAFPVFRVSGFDLWEPKVFCAWLTQIGRRLAVLRCSLSASICSRGYSNLPRGCINPVDFWSFCQYRPTIGLPPTGAGYVTGGHARLPADGVPAAEIGTGGCSRHFQAGRSIAVRPRPFFHREIQFGPSPFAGAKCLCLTLARGASEAVPPSPGDREYSAGCRLLPLLVQMISFLLIMFHSVVRMPALSSATVGNLDVNSCSISSAVNRSFSLEAIAALIVSESLENPVACAVKRPRDAFTAASNCRFFCTRLMTNSASFSSFSICLTRSEWMPRSLICSPSSLTLSAAIRI